MSEIKLNTIEEAIEDFREGKFLIVGDDEDRERTCISGVLAGYLYER